MESAFSRYDIDLHFYLIPQFGLNRRSRGKNGNIFEKVFVNGVEAVEVFDVGQMHGAFHNVIQSAASGAQNLFDVRERQLRFFLDGAADDFRGLRIQRRLPADVNPAVDFHSRGIGASAFFFFGVFDFFFGHKKIFFSELDLNRYIGASKITGQIIPSSESDGR